MRRLGSFTDTLADCLRDIRALPWNHTRPDVTPTKAQEADKPRGSPCSNRYVDHHRGFRVRHVLRIPLVEIGHYPEDRSGNKGVEPEG